MRIFCTTKKIFSLWLVLLITGVWEGIAWTQEVGKVSSVLEADSRGFRFSISGIMTFTGGFSATVMREMQPRELLSTMGLPEFQPGQTQELNSAEGVLLSEPESFAEQTPLGRATGKELALHFDRVQLDLLVRISQVPGISGFQVQAGVRNSGPSPVRLLSLSPMVMEGQVEGNPLAWLVTALNTSVKDAPPVVALSEIQKPFTVFEYGGFYSFLDGDGFLFGPVGAPCAYVQASIEHKGDGKVAFTCTAEMSGVQVRPGETRWGQQVALFAEAPGRALAHWADWIAKTHNARTDKGALSGWNSYSVLSGNSTGQGVLAEVETVLKNPDRLRPMVMEIDTGYEQGVDKTGTHNLFSKGLPFYAQRIAETGSRPGVLLNFQGPPGFETMAQRIKEMVQKGFTYLKINRTFLTFEEEAVPHKTSFEQMREGFTRLRAAAGEGTYLLYNNSTPDRASVGLVDANRTGVDSHRSSVSNAMTDVLRSYHLNNRWFAVDNDAYFMDTDIPNANVSVIAGGWPVVRTWMSMTGLSCGAALTSDPWHVEGFRRYWRNVEVMTPPAREETMVLDLCTTRNWPRLVGHVKRAWGEQYVALLWNPETFERNVKLSFTKAGMNPNHRYAVWSFWDNRYLGVTKGTWTALSLGPSASQHLCFTDLDDSSNKPVLIGSGLHIYCGAAEIKQVSSSRGAMEIELTDAGAREGDLFIYSRRQPVWKAAVGCTVAEIASAGEFVWRLHLVDRKSGEAQRVALKILLPVTQQIWFWALIGTVLLSLLFAAWRYVAALRFQRVYALEKERSRIARDIHDDLGASLTQIALLSELAQADAHKPEVVRGHTNEIFTMARTLTRSVDEIVWAVNPANDTVEKFAAFIGQYVERFARTSGLSFQLEIPDELPPRPMEASLRHHLFLAIKEALHNVEAHAGARTVRLDLSLTGIWLKLVIADDGRGFIPEELSASGVAGGAGAQDRVGGGQGLSNMRQRMAAIAGRFEIRSAPGQGTRVTLQVKVGGRVNV